MNVDVNQPIVHQMVDAIHRGEVERLVDLLSVDRGLAAARLVDGDSSFTFLHVATDWPGHFPRVAETIRVLVSAGAEVDGRYDGPHVETPLHWAASSDDVEALDALLDAGADVDADGAVIGGGPPLADARAFAQWRAAHRLVQGGARVTLADAATLGLFDHLESAFRQRPGPSPAEIDRAFWGACHGGQLLAAQYLQERGANLDWVPPWEPLTPLDAAERREAGDVVRWLRALGATSHTAPARRDVGETPDAERDSGERSEVGCAE